jgi:polar amino acid transport system substrate-binding protein
MRPSRILALVAAASLAAACTRGGASQSASSTPSASAPASASESTPAEPSAAADACDPESLPTKTAGKLTIATDNPAYPPYFLPRKGGNTQPWDPSQGDPTTGEGFESAVAYAVAEQLGFTTDEVSWTVVPFNDAIAPGVKDFDFDINQVAFTPERAKAVDLTDGYYFGNQSVVVNKGGKFEKVTTVSGLKDAKLGAQVGTTSLKAIEDVIKPTKDVQVYDTNDAAIQALRAKQIDGVMVDLPTAFYIVFVQTGEKTAVIGQLGPDTGATPEHFSLLLSKGSPLTPCVNQAVGALTADGTLASLADKWLSDKNVPELKP